MTRIGPVRTRKHQIVVVSEVETADLDNLRMGFEWKEPVGWMHRTAFEAEKTDLVRQSVGICHIGWTVRFLVVLGLCSVHSAEEREMEDREQQLGGLLASQLTASELGRSLGLQRVAEEQVVGQLLAQLGSVGVVEHESLLPRGRHQRPHLQIRSSWKRQIELQPDLPHGSLAYGLPPLGLARGVGSLKPAQGFLLPSMPKLEIHWSEDELLEAGFVAM
jgi:hypothetical protein